MTSTTKAIFAALRFAMVRLITDGFVQFRALLEIVSNFSSSESAGKIRSASPVHCNILSVMEQSDLGAIKNKYAKASLFTMAVNT